MAEAGFFEEEVTRWVKYQEDTEVLLCFVDREALVAINEKAEAISRKVKDPTAISHITKRELGRTIVKGWRKINDHSHPGFTIAGKPLPFTPENLDRMVKKSVEFFSFISREGSNPATFLQEEEAREESKNS